MYVGGGTYLVVLCHIISELPQLPSSNSLQTTSPFHSTGSCLKMISITTLQQVLLLEKYWMTPSINGAFSGWLKAMVMQKKYMTNILQFATQWQIHSNPTYPASINGSLSGWIRAMTNGETSHKPWLPCLLPLVAIIYQHITLISTNTTIYYIVQTTDILSNNKVLHRCKIKYNPVHQIQLMWQLREILKLCR